MICNIYPVAAAGGTFHWKWRGKDGKRKSERTFELFYDCVEDARDHGLDVDLTQVHLDIADGTENRKLVARPRP